MPEAFPLQQRKRLENQSTTTSHLHRNPMASSLPASQLNSRRKLILGLVVFVIVALMTVNLRLETELDHHRQFTGEVLTDPRMIPARRKEKLDNFPSTMTSIDKVIDPKHPKKMLIFVLASEAQYASRGVAVRDTWQDYANNKYPELGIHVVLAYDGLPTKEQQNVPMFPVQKTGYVDLYKKVFEAFETVWELYGEDYDYYMKADDDVFVHIDRLAAHFNNRDKFDPESSVVYGFRGPEDFMCWGGPGYILSKAALREIYPHLSQCSKDFILPEDIGVSWCFMRYYYNVHHKPWGGCQGLSPRDKTGFCHIPPYMDSWQLWNTRPDQPFAVEGTMVNNWRFSTLVSLHAFKSEKKEYDVPTMQDYYNHVYANTNHFVKETDVQETRLQGENNEAADGREGKVSADESTMNKELVSDKEAGAKDRKGEGQPSSTKENQ